MTEQRICDDCGRQRADSDRERGDEGSEHYCFTARTVLGALDCLQRALGDTRDQLSEAQARAIGLEALINTPQTDDFVQAVRIEAAHQVERWGTKNDEGKSPTDWFWLLGYLGGKAVWAATHGDRDKALHHTISTAAACLNWHRALSGTDTAMRPGIAEPGGES